MGINICPNSYSLDNEKIFEAKIRELNRDKISDNKFLVKLQLIEPNENKITNPPIEFEVIHTDTVENTTVASKEYINQGCNLPFIYNSINQTNCVEISNRKMAGNMAGNIYTSISIPNNMIKSELNNIDTILKITAISIVQHLRRLEKNVFFLKHPNDIICKDNKILGGIIAENYKDDFCIITFAINIVDSPEQDHSRKELMQSCYVNAHMIGDKKKVNPLELSVDITKQIFYNISFTSSDIDNLFQKYV